MNFLSIKNSLAKAKESEELPVIHLVGILEDIFKTLDEGDKIAEIERSVVKYKVDGHYLTYSDDIVAVFILLNNGLFV